MSTLPIGMAMGSVIGLCIAYTRLPTIADSSAMQESFRHLDHLYLALSPRSRRTIAIIATCCVYSIVGALLSAWLWAASRAAASLLE